MLDFLGGLAGKESAYNVWDLALISGLGRSPGKVKGYPLQYSGLENYMDYIVHRSCKKARYDWVTFTFIKYWIGKYLKIKKKKRTHNSLMVLEQIYKIEN